MTQNTYSQNAVEHFIKTTSKIIEINKAKKSIGEFLLNNNFKILENHDKDYAYFSRYLDNIELVKLQVKIKTSLIDESKIFLLSCFNEEWILPFDFDQIEELKNTVTQIINLPNTIYLN